MKKFLSLVMALVMVMSLVTISAGAKDFTDNDSITYDEAVAVVSEVGIVDGYTDGKFNPTNTLTRQAAAKIICNLILGPTTAAELHADTAPYKDVAVNNEFAGYIAYCQSRGIISGYADGNFRPGNTLTGYAFMKMLLGALGYDSTLEGYVGSNWSINVAKQALGIGLADGLELKEGAVFNGIKAVNREEACLYAFNTLQADLVEYNQRVTTTINGTEVTLSSGGAQAKKWANQTQRTRIDNIRDDEIIQFAEEYFRKLEKKLGDDDFMRPAYTWIYDKEEIGTYVDWTLMTEEYTTEVTGRDLYDLLGSALLGDNDMDLVYYVNGDVPDTSTILPSWVCANDGSADITKNNNTIRRNNQDGVGITADGVLTQVFIDKDVREKIIITSIDTWLAKGGADYNESKETAPIDVWTTNGGDPDVTRNVDVQDVPEVADVTEDTFYLVNISFKNDTAGEIVTISEPDILEESVVTKFSTKNSLPTKLTTGGTEYKAAKREHYDVDALDSYNESLLTDRTYNVILDPYGFVIGVELCEGAKNYIFITGFDRPQSNLTVKTASAAGILLDGTMQEIKVNVTDTDKNIKAVNKQLGDRGASASWIADLEAAEEYFIPWQDITMALNQDGFHALNRWFTYSVNKDGVYTLKPATKMIAYKNSADETIKTSNLYLDDNVMYNAAVNGNATDPYHEVHEGAGAVSTIGNALNTGSYQYPYSALNDARVYGNDDSVYITVETDIVDTLTAKSGSISGVTGVYTGVQNVEIELNIADIAADRPIDEAYVYAVYDRNNYIIGAVTVGEADGGNATIAYVTSGPKSERIEDGFYYWEFDAIVDGTEQTMTVKEKYGSVFGTGADKSMVGNEASAYYKAVTNAYDYDKAHGGYSKIASSSSSRNWNAYDGIVELRKDADDYVVSVKAVEETDVYSYYGDKYATAPNYKGGNSIVTADNGNVYNTATGAMSKGIDDAKVYRIGTIRDKMLAGTDVTWDYPTASPVYHHYDSAPEELTLVGRTLYVTADQHDEGLALTSDAKAVVIQRENGKWKTREFNNVSSAVAQVVDAQPGAAYPGRQFNGEVIAPINSRGQATWVLFISYENMVTGAGNIPQGDGRVTNVAVDYVNPDAPTDTQTNDEFIAFVLYGTTPGKRYDVTINTSFGGVTTTRHKTVTGASSGNVTRCTTLADGVYGKLDPETYVTVTCEDGVGTYQVPVLGSQHATTVLS